MEIEFLGQPFSTEGRLGCALPDALSDAESLWVVSAWAQMAGLEAIADDVRDLRSRGGSASALVGIDGGIATRESLELVVELFEPALVFHDTNRLFHPKLYCVERPGETILAVGSSNLTGGGLFENYEANAVFRLDPGSPRDSPIYEAATNYRDALLRDDMPCRTLTVELIARLAEDESLVTTRKRRNRAEQAARRRSSRLAEEIFGPPPADLPSAPHTRRQRGDRHRSTGKGAEPATSTDTSVADRWWKELTASDVLRKPKGSHPRNYVVLTKAGHGIDPKTWFRKELFGSAPWSKEAMYTGNTKEVALIPFEVVIDGKSLGPHELMVDHGEHRIADQGNSPTYLNWSNLTDVIRQTDFRNWWLEIARLTDGTFRLQLLREEPLAN
jgi:PLD-like domain